MPVETANFISQLNASYPLGSDDSGDGDNHLRMLKNVLKAQFPEFTAAALNATQAEIEAAIASVTGLAKLLLLSGSAAAPGLAVVGDEDTGIYSPGANQLAVACAGALVALVSASGLSVTGTVSSSGGFTGPGAMPIGGSMPWFSDTAPTGYGTWAWMNGQTLSAATYVALAAVYPNLVSGGLIYLPDTRERALIGRSTMGGAAWQGLIPQYDISALKTLFGEGRHTMLLTELVSHSHGGYTGYTDVNHTHNFSYLRTYSNNGNLPTGAFSGLHYNSGEYGSSGTTGYSNQSLNHLHTIAAEGGGQPFNVVQPGIVCNWIMRVA